MCTYIVYGSDVMGSGKGTTGWFAINKANVAYDHPVAAPIEHAILIDFVNEAMGPGARVAVELTPESARGLVQAILSTLEDGKKQQVLEEGGPVKVEAVV